jgi:uncharacterized membrane protein YfcA
LDITLLASLGLTSIGTSVISAVVGMAGGIVLLSIMTFFLPIATLIPIHGVVQLISNGTRTYLLRKNIVWKIVVPFAIGIPFGVIASVYILKEINNTTLPLTLIGILIFYSIFKPKNLPPLKIPYWGFAILGMFSGVLSLLVGATGPFLAPFFLRDDLIKEEMISTKSAVQILTHFLKLPAFIYLGFNYWEYKELIIIMVVGAVIGTHAGVRVLHLIPEKIFRIIFKSALFFAGCRIVYKVITSS